MNSQHNFSGASISSAFKSRIAALEINGENILAIHNVRAHRGGRDHVLIRCPAHDDEHPSCSVMLATGRARCFACGFKAGDVVSLHRALGGLASMGDALRDLEQRRGSRAPRLTLAPSAPHRGASRTIARGKRVVVKTWAYELADGTPAFEVSRIQFRLADSNWALDADKGKPAKVYLPAHPGGSPRRMPHPYSAGALRPLLCLPAIIAAPLDTAVYVGEGEPCVDALASLGLLATTSSGGAANSHKTDWTPLAGRLAVIWPDNDAAGLRYAVAVTSILTALTPAAAVEWVDIERIALPIGGDAVDWVDRRNGSDE